MEEKAPALSNCAMVAVQAGIADTPSKPKLTNGQSTNSSSTTLQYSSQSSSDTALNIEAHIQPKILEDLDLRQANIDLEAQKALPKPTPEDILPPPKSQAWLRYAVVNTYRRLFSLVFIGNAVGFVYVVATDKKLFNVVNAAAANLLALGLARQPLVVNLMFKTFGSVPRIAPLAIRQFCTKIYCYGGVHSGCGVAALTWYLGFIGLLTQQYASKSSPIYLSPAVLALSYIILALLLAIIIAAYPAIRFKLHDYFELTHRFCGWAVVALFWPLLILFSFSAAHASQQPLERFLLTFPTFWMIIITTVAIIHPWILLRKVKATPEQLSTHAIRLHFDHTTINFGQGLSLSKHPLRDWHSFATFPDQPTLPGYNGTSKGESFSCLVSKAGDWTTDTITNAPTHFYKRAVPIYGFGYCMKLFTRIITVTTGSGIGPCLSFIGDPDRPTMRVVWQTKAPLKTYGQPVIDLVSQLDADAVILDTSKEGRRDMLPLVVELYRNFNAEAVCVISNPMVTRKLVFECESRGIPAFGPIFDS